MAVSKKSIAKPAARKLTTRAAKVTKNAAAPAGKMVTAMKMAKTATLARNVGGIAPH